MDPQILVYLFFVLTLSIFLGFELISKVPATLHTPLMSGANAISGITIVGAILSAGGEGNTGSYWLGAAAVFFATINVIGGYYVTDRMLGMFKKKSTAQPGGDSA
ncbi:MAG: NAD(P) transhydrogenase subunit alpha [Candidatus Omnitrophica bacterium]|nr:NAD(P) transhydrogenase subunit alpha [Candidatus Omnitrophota bacterium]